MQAGSDQAGRGIATVQAGLSGRSGQHVLAAELLLFMAIVGMRAVATYGPGDKKNLPADQYGPLFILGNGFAVFFVLSFLAAKGGTWAKVAGIFGLLIDVALLLKSTAHLDSIAAEYAKPRVYVPENISGSTSTAEAPVLSPALQAEITTGKIPPAPKGSSPAAAMAYARKSLAAHGLAASQFPSLVRLWNAESGWNINAVNPGSGATGIPQLNPHDHKVPAHWDSIAVQVNWGLAYIRQRYGSIAAAWAHEQHFGWY